MKSIIVTEKWWKWFNLEYDRGDCGYQFSHITIIPVGNKLQITADDTFVLTEKEDINNVGETVWSWLTMIIRTDADPYGWVMEAHESMDRSEWMKAFNYVRGCRRIMAQLKEVK